jgi:hypothetical protein
VGLRLCYPYDMDYHESKLTLLETCAGGCIKRIPSTTRYAQSVAHDVTSVFSIRSEFFSQHAQAVAFVLDGA